METYVIYTNAYGAPWVLNPYIIISWRALLTAHDGNDYTDVQYQLGTPKKLGISSAALTQYINDMEKEVFTFALADGSGDIHVPEYAIARMTKDTGGTIGLLFNNGTGALISADFEALKEDFVYVATSAGTEYLVSNYWIDRIIPKHGIARLVVKSGPYLDSTVDIDHLPLPEDMIEVTSNGKQILLSKLSVVKYQAQGLKTQVSCLQGYSDTLDIGINDFKAFMSDEDNPDLELLVGMNTVYIPPGAIRSGVPQIAGSEISAADIVLMDGSVLSTLSQYGTIASRFFKITDKSNNLMSFVTSAWLEHANDKLDANNVRTNTYLTYADGTKIAINESVADLQAQHP